MSLIPSVSLIPENDPTTLFSTSSGMQPLVPYLLGQAHPEGNRLVNSQKSFRAQDIEEVGDNRHTTYFEMLGKLVARRLLQKGTAPMGVRISDERFGLIRSGCTFPCSRK